LGNPSDEGTKVSRYDATVIDPSCEREACDGCVPRYRKKNNARNAGVCDLRGHHRDAELYGDQVGDRRNLGSYLSHRRIEAHAPATFNNLVVKARPKCAREQDERLALQLCQIHSIPDSKSMTRRDNNHHRLFVKQSDGEARRGFLAGTNEDCVKALPAQLVKKLGAVQFFQCKLDIAVGTAERAQRSRHDLVERRRAGVADSKLTYFPSAASLREFDGLVELVEDRRNGRQERYPSLCQFGAFWHATEEPNAYLVLKVVDLTTQWWLRDAQLLGGAPEVQFLGDCEEVP
jgi:hypothetical protein